MRVHVQRRGSGPPLLLLHGIGHRWQAWEPVLDRLAVAHDVVALDLPGFGASPVPDDGLPVDMDSTVARFRRLLGELGLVRPHVAGNSLGGAIALELAAAGLVASATALSPAGFDTAQERRRAMRMLMVLRANTFVPVPLLRLALRSDRIRAMSFGTLVARPERLGVDRMVGDAVAMRRGRGFRAVVRQGRAYRFCADGAATHQVPVTIAWGAQDQILPPHEGQRARQMLPQARHVRLPGCGHVPMSDAPDLVAEVILTTTGALE